MDPIVVLEDDDLLVMYVAQSGRSALTVFSRDLEHDLVAAEGAVRAVVLRPVRYRPAQEGQLAHLIINYAGELRAEVRSRLAVAIVNAIKMLG